MALRKRVGSLIVTKRRPNTRLVAPKGGFDVPQVVDTPTRFRIRTIGGVLTELCRIYRLGHQDKMEWGNVSHAARTLREIRMILETSAIEARIVAIEEALKANGSALPPGRPNGLGARL